MFELYSLRYGKQADLDARDTVLFQAANGEQPLPQCRFQYFFWLARTENRRILIDCGFSREAGARRGRTTIASVLDLLLELDISGSDIDAIVLTHLHYDHAGNLDLFPNARIFAHEKEWQWATGPRMRDGALAKYYDPSSIAELVKRLYRGDVSIMTGSSGTLFGLGWELIGGHCPGQLVISVPTRTGKVVLASDASHLDRNWQERNPFPILHNLDDAMRGFDFLSDAKASAAAIISGHDPEVFGAYEKVGPSGNILALHRPLGGS